MPKTGKSNPFEKKNLYYTRDITPKRVTSGGAHLRGIAPGQHSSEKTLQQWQIVNDSVIDLTKLEIEPRPPAPIGISLPLRQPAGNKNMEFRWHSDRNEFVYSSAP